MIFVETALLKRIYLQTQNFFIFQDKHLAIIVIFKKDRLVLL